MKSATSTTTNAGTLSSNSFFFSEQQDLYNLSADKKLERFAFFNKKLTASIKCMKQKHNQVVFCVYSRKTFDHKKLPLHRSRYLQ